MSEVVVKETEAHALGRRMARLEDSIQRWQREKASIDHLLDLLYDAKNETQLQISALAQRKVAVT